MPEQTLPHEVVVYFLGKHVQLYLAQVSGISPSHRYALVRAASFPGKVIEIGLVNNRGKVHSARHKVVYRKGVDLPTIGEIQPFEMRQGTQLYISAPVEGKSDLVITASSCLQVIEQLQVRQSEMYARRKDHRWTE